MQYKIHETLEAVDDIIRFAEYMIQELGNPKAATDFINTYDDMASKLKIFPRGYRGVSIEYRGYEIKIKPFGTYNVFFVIDETKHNIIILRVLKDIQDWNFILQHHNEYHFK